MAQGRECLRRVGAGVVALLLQILTPADRPPRCRRRSGSAARFSVGPATPSFPVWRSNSFFFLAERVLPGKRPRRCRVAALGRSGPRTVPRGGQGPPRGEDRTALRVIVACWRHSLLSVQADSGSLTVAGQDRYRPASTRKTQASNLRQFLPNTEFNRANSSERRRIVTLGHLIAGRKVIRSISNGWGINNGRAMFSVRCSSDSQQL